jgi:DNA-binding NarL/FixJ family response regulator
MPTLSDRELAILHHLVRGHTGKMIARELAITEAAVMVAVRRLVSKLGVKSRFDAISWARNRGNGAY